MIFLVDAKNGGVHKISANSKIGESFKLCKTCGNKKISAMDYSYIYRSCGELVAFFELAV
jgi:hypothetical protein